MAEKDEQQDEQILGNSANDRQWLRHVKNDRTGWAEGMIEKKPVFDNACDWFHCGCCWCLLPLWIGCHVGYCSSCMRSCGCWCPYSGTYIFWSVYYKNLESVKLLHDKGAELNANLRNGENVLQYAKNSKAPESIIAYLEHAMSAPTPQTMERYGNRALDALGKTHKKYAFFLTHHKRDAAATVTMLRESIAKRLEIDSNYVFLDYDRRTSGIYEICGSR